MSTLPTRRQQDLRVRLKTYSLRILKLYDSLPKYGSAQIVGHQIARPGTSPGAHYREACKAKSDADFVSKIEGALQELGETDYWIELLVDGSYVPEEKLSALKAETNELIAVLVTIVRKVKGRKKSRAFILLPSSIIL